MAVTSPTVSSQDAAPITPETTTGASLLAREKPLDVAPEDATPGANHPPIPFATLSYIRPSRSQSGALPLGPEPTTSELSHTLGEGSPPAPRAEAIERPTEEPKLPGPGVTGPLEIARGPALEEEGIAASQAERENLTYWKSERAQAKRPLEGLETAVGAFKEEEDVIGEKALVEPEKIAYWKQPRVFDPAKYTAETLTGLPSVLMSQATGLENRVEKAAQTLQEDVDGEKALIEPEKITYWKQPRVFNPTKYASAAFTGLPPVLISQATGFENHVEKAVETLQEDVDGGKALIAPEKITYWTQGRVTDPAKYAPAALAALPANLKDIGLGIANPHLDVLPLAPTAPAPSIPVVPISAPPVPASRAARECSRSEYSDYRSSIISFHSSDATLSSGQRRPPPEVRNSYSSPYL
jgi:hypothetical protein